MSENKPHQLKNVPSLKTAMRRARLEQAEQSDVLAELRGAEIARLEMLAEELEPVYAQIPDHIDMFDAGVTPGERPRLFIDMIGFVEMDDDKRTYRFVQDTRHGRIIVKESDRAETMVTTITEYIGRRLLERERALASDMTIEDAARNLHAAQAGGQSDGAAPSPSPGQAVPADSPEAATPGDTQDKAKPARADTGPAAPSPVSSTATPAAAAPGDRSLAARLWDVIEFLALFIGFVVLLTAICGAVYYMWTTDDFGLVSKFIGSGR